MGYRAVYSDNHGNRKYYKVIGLPFDSFEINKVGNKIVDSFDKVVYLIQSGKSVGQINVGDTIDIKWHDGDVERSVEYTFTAYDKFDVVDSNVHHNWCLEQTYAPDTKAYDTYESLFCLKENATLTSGKWKITMTGASAGTQTIYFETTQSYSGKIQFASTGYNYNDKVSGKYVPDKLQPKLYGTNTNVGGQINLLYSVDNPSEYVELNTSDLYLGYIDKSALGNNSWKYSNMREWLNDDTLGDTWQPTHPNDIASSYNRGKGFLYGIDSNVLKYIQTTKIKWTSGYNNTGETQNQTYESQDKVFLLSMKEMSFNLNTNEGNVTDLYDEYVIDEKGSSQLTNDVIAMRSKYNRSGGTKNNFRWSRSAITYYANNSSIVYSTGSNAYRYASGGNYFAPAFVIGTNLDLVLERRTFN